jgi:hypothetical protein
VQLLNPSQEVDPSKEDGDLLSQNTAA